MSPAWFRSKESSEPLPIEPLDPGAIAAAGVCEEAIAAAIRECVTYLANVPGRKEGVLVESLVHGFRSRLEAQLANTSEGRQLCDAWHGVQPQPVRRRPFNVWDCEASMEDD